MTQEEHLLSRMHWRYSPKSFAADKKIPRETWEALARSLLLTPSSYGLQPWKFLVIQDEPLRAALRAVSWNQRQVTECSHYVVLAGRVEIDEAYVEGYIQSVVSARGVSVDSLAGLRKSILGDVVHGGRAKIVAEWAARQAYIALGNLVTSAATLSVDSCPMEGFDPLRYDEILGLKGSPYRSVVACALGYRNLTDPLAQMAKVRFAPAEIFDYR